MNQQVKTWLGTAILIIMAITFGTFVLVAIQPKSDCGLQCQSASPSSQARG